MKENYSNTEISRKLNVSPDAVSSINCGKHFKKENESYPIRKAFSKRDERANKIKALLKEGTLNNKQIADIVGCDPSVVSNINYGKVFKDPLISYPIRPKNKTCIDYPRIGGVGLLLIRSSKKILLV